MIVVQGVVVPGVVVPGVVFLRVEITVLRVSDPPPTPQTMSQG